MVVLASYSPLCCKTTIELKMYSHYSVVLGFVILLSLLNKGVAAWRDDLSTEEESVKKQYDTAVKWIEELGGFMFGCSIRNTQYAGMGVFAKFDMKKRTSIIRTPMAAIITTCDTEHHLVPDDFSSALETEDLNGALFIAHEQKKGDSFWQPYLDILPADDLGILSFTENDIKELDGSEVAQRAKKFKKELNQAIEQFFEDWRVNPILPTQITREDVKWALHMWYSRCFQGPQEGCVMLVPLADMFNVAVGSKLSNVRCSDNWKGSSYAFVCSLTKDVTAGEELLLDYSYDPNYRFNAKLLLDYGFTVRNNPYDSVTLKAPYLPTDLPHYLIRSLLAAEFFPDIIYEHYYQLRKLQGGHDDELVHFMRLKYGTLWEISEAAELEEPFSQPLSVQTEQRVWSYILELLLDVQKNYTTSIWEDEEILQQNTLSENSCKAVILRLGEKIILEDSIEYVTNHLEKISQGSIHKEEL